MLKRFLLGTLSLGCLAANAAEVSREQAVSIALQKVDGEVASAKVVSYEGQKVYYVVQFAEGGWVLVSADDTTMPVIGYSNEGVYQTEGQPESVSSFMNGLARDVISNKSLGRRAEGWDKRTVSSRRQASAEKIEPLIKVNWNQTNPYNYFCPGDGQNKAVVGCVAVGMAQAMSVAQWPPRPEGEYSYNCEGYGQQYINYDKQPEYDWDAILSGAAMKLPVARLLWHCGVAVNMKYGPDGSGTQDSYIASALKRNFQYPQSVKYYSRKGFQGSDDDWKELILNELRAGRAVAYSGSDPNSDYGHCFNLDGFDGEFFHVNWGWGGTNNGNFPLTGLKDAKMGYTYTEGQSVIVGIRPPSEKPSDITLSATQVQGGQPEGTYVCDVLVESEATNPTYEYELKGKYSVISHKYLAAAFKVEDNKLYTTKSLNENTTQEVTIKATNVQNKGTVERTFKITVTSGPAGVTEVNADNLSSRQYFSLSGSRLNEPGKGVTIIRQRTTDGKVHTIKKIMK